MFRKYLHMIAIAFFAGVASTCGEVGAQGPVRVVSQSGTRAPVRAVVSDKTSLARNGVLQDDAETKPVGPAPVLTEDHSMHVPNHAALHAALAGADPYSHRARDFGCAGYPQCLRPWAVPSERPAYWGYYVGGGAPVLGEGRCADEGTFGWDYFGLLYQRRVDLNWTHGRYQGGTGRYRTDGAKVGRD